MTPEQTRLVLAHQSRVQALAWTLRRRLPPSIEMDDLTADGCVGLVNAALAFDPSRGVQFWTFAYHKVYFAMIDGLRQDHGRRTFRDYGPKAAPFVMPIGECYHEDGTPKSDELRQLIEPGPSPEDCAAHAERRGRLLAAMATLPTREVRILCLQLRGLTMDAIGAVIGVNQSRVSQLRRRAVRKIRAAVAA